MKTRQIIKITFGCLIVALCLISPSQASARIRIPKVKVRIPKVKVTSRLKPTRIESSIRNYDGKKNLTIVAARSAKFQQQQDEKRRQRIRGIQKRQFRFERPTKGRTQLALRDFTPSR
jgi:ribosomal protein S1